MVLQIVDIGYAWPSLFSLLLFAFIWHLINEKVKQMSRAVLRECSSGDTKATSRFPHPQHAGICSASNTTIHAFLALLTREPGCAECF